MATLEQAKRDLDELGPDQDLPESVRNALILPEEDEPGEGQVSRLASQTGKSAILSVTEGGTVSRIMVSIPQGGAWWFDQATGKRI